MTFLIIVAVLFAERYLLLQEDFRRHLWFQDYIRWFYRLPFGAALRDGNAAIVAALALPLIAIVTLQSWLGDSLAGIPGAVFAFAVLLMSLGPEDLERAVTGYLDARDHGSEERARRIASGIIGRPADEPEPERSLRVTEAIVEQANNRLFAPLFWFVLLGALGAALYRLAQLVRGYTENDPERADIHLQTRRLLYLLDWLPARLTAATYALVGNFDNVLLAWRHWRDARYDEFPSEAGGLLVSTGIAALSHPPEQVMPEDPRDLPPLVEDALGLVLRSLVVVVAGLGLVSLMRWIS